MGHFSSLVKNRLMSIIDKMAKSPDHYVKNPGKDFSRNRKLPFRSVIHLLISMGGNSLYKELLELHGYDENTATSSAFIQQRDKILPYAFEHLLNEFTHSFSNLKKYRNHRLLAADGTSLHIATNPDDKESFIQTRPDAKGYNILHLNVMYDLCNKIYVDSITQPQRCEDERKALINMVNRSCIDDKTIIIGDRNYESYNVFAHIERRGWKYLIRVRDVDCNSTSIVSALTLPTSEEFDIIVHRIITRTRSKEVKSNPHIYRYINDNQRFDFIDLHTGKTYPISFRIARFKIRSDLYETVITNLEQSEFPAQELKALYKMRWGIETSFREIKYAVGLIYFHSKKREHIAQEIFARIIMYNLAEMITSHVVISKFNTKHTYQVNFTVAIHICRRFLRYWSHAPPLDVEALIRKNILPVRPDRIRERKPTRKTSVSFLYRVA